MWFEDRSEGQIDLLDRDRPQTELIMQQARRLLEQRRRYSSTTPADMSLVSPPFSPAGGTHTLSIGEVPPQFPTTSAIQQHNNNNSNQKMDIQLHQDRMKAIILVKVKVKLLQV